VKILTHKLMRVSLANWYLFEQEDFNVNGMSLMISGANGSGKSTILDAIQTVMAGADEKKLNFNATASTGGKAKRSIKYYCLGKVGEAKESDGYASLRRKKSNSYITLCFQKPDGSYYSFGCHFYANADRSQVEKNLFIAKGQDMASLDFMESEYSILTFKDFQSRWHGKIETCHTSKEFREKICELMSPAGLNYSINPDQLFSTLSKGLKFKQQTDVTEFIRSYILPPQDIDVARIENDYAQYRKIKVAIENAVDRLSRLKEIIRHLEAWRSSTRKAAGFKWAISEAQVCKADMALEALEERKESLGVEIAQHSIKVHLLNDEAEILSQARDAALTKKESSDITGQVAKGESRLAILIERAKGHTDQITQCRKLLSDIEAVQVPRGVNTGLADTLQAAIAALQSATRFDEEDAFYQWPASESQIADTFQAIDALATPLNGLSEIVDQYNEGIKGANNEIEDLLSIHKQLSSGKASLTKPTLAFLEILEDAGIKALPVCDLAEVTDSDWQWGIERFLGVWNREALLILDGNDQPADNVTLDKALQLYRQAKEQAPVLRSVKVLNPGKISEPKGVPDPGTAAALIKSDNRTVRDYLQSMLYGVQLVDTEAQLRQHRRAITKDGMVAGNGSISGGNKIEFLLLGEAVRRGQAEELSQRLNHLTERASALRNDLLPIKGAEQTLKRALQDLEPFGTTIVEAFKSIVESVREQNDISARLKLLQEDSDYATLEAAFQDADEAVIEHAQKVRSAASIGGSLERQQAEIEDQLPELEREIASAREGRLKAEMLELFDQEIASNAFCTLEEARGDDFAGMQADAETQASKSYMAGNKSREEARLKISNLANHHGMADGKAWVDAHPLEALSKCEASANHLEQSEIARYEEDAKNITTEMIHLFRNEVSSKLKDNLVELDNHLRVLNQSLKDLKFNSLQFTFIKQRVDIESLNQVYDYVMLPDDANQGPIGGLWDDSNDHPGLAVIERVITEGRLNEIGDYRNFYTYDINTRDTNTDITRRFSSLLGDGSGGEKQSPFYVALAASYMNAYQLRKRGDSGVVGGAALALFDEAMNDMDAANSAAVMGFFHSLGLQVIIAAPPETAVKIGTTLDRTVTVVKQGFSVFLDEYSFSEEAAELLNSDNPHMHPEIVDEHIKCEDLESSTQDEESTEQANETEDGE